MDPPLRLGVCGGVLSNGRVPNRNTLLLPSGLEGGGRQGAAPGPLLQLGQTKPPPEAMQLRGNVFLPRPLPVMQSPRHRVAVLTQALRGPCLVPAQPRFQRTGEPLALGRGQSSGEGVAGTGGFGAVSVPSITNPCQAPSQQSRG